MSIREVRVVVKEWYLASLPTSKGGVHRPPEPRGVDGRFSPACIAEEGSGRGTWLDGSEFVYRWQRFLVCAADTIMYIS